MSKHVQSDMLSEQDTSVRRSERKKSSVPKPTVPKKKTPPPTTSTRRSACKSGKCSVPGCTNKTEKISRTSYRKKCRRHRHQCSFPGCDKHAQFSSANGRFCINHGQSEAPEACAQHCEKPRNDLGCSYPGCTKQRQVVTNGSRFCHNHLKTEAPEAYAEYRQRRNRRIREHYRTNPEFRLRMLARGRLQSALKAQGTSYQGKNKLLGCSADQFKRYLAQFFSEPGNDWMNWDNQGRIEGVRCWEMDHIYPLSKLKLTDPEVLRRAAHWSNFQPLSAAENQSEGATIPDGFEWRDDLDRWWWSEDSGRINYELPAAGAEDVTIDDLFDYESDESEDDSN